MKVLKIFFSVIVAIIALVLIVAIFLPSQYKVERSMVINKSDTLVYNYVSDFNNFKGWNPWSQMEPDHKFEVTGNAATVGHKYYWEGKEIGSGQMIFTELIPYNFIKSDIEFLTPQSGKGIVEFKFEPQENSTKFSWAIVGDAEYPIGRYMGMLMDTFLGKNFEDGVANLKLKCEAL
jgi:hypothetical protein